MTKLQQKFAKLFAENNARSMLELERGYEAPEKEAEFYEQLAVFLAAELKSLVTRGRSTPGKHQQLEPKIACISILNTQLEAQILSQANRFCNPRGEVTNPYLQYYLTQLSRFNAESNRLTSIDDYRSNQRTDIVHGHGKLAVIPSLILNQHSSESVEIRATVHRAEGRFRPVHVYSTKQTGRGFDQYFYRPINEQRKGRAHQDETAYAAVNQAIFKATQSSNISEVFKSALSVLPGVTGQGRDSYFKPADIRLHEAEVKLFKGLQQKIKQGLVLSEDEKALIREGRYYRKQSPLKFTLPKEVRGSDGNMQITHISHASEYIHLKAEVPLHVNIDPVHYQSGTDGLVRAAASIFYDRQTEAAFATDEYPEVNVVLLSHNHHDHMCTRSLQEIYAGNPSTLFIVPKGDKATMEGFGLKNVIELSSWDDYVQITLIRGDQISHYEIAALPANHASNRSLNDMFKSLYLGYLIKNIDSKELILCTGDTAVLDEQHFQDLEAYLLENDFTIRAACIAHGPDRPRSQMRITHQSTADAVAMHARFNAMNYKVMDRRAENAFSSGHELLQQAACAGIGYHQGCYRLGLLSLNDVPSTLTRMLAVLDSLQDKNVSDLLKDGAIQSDLSNNLHFAMMDDFEREGLLDTICIYQTLLPYIRAGEVLDLISAKLHVPQPGSRTDLAEQLPNEGFEFDYQRLMVNRDPAYVAGSPPIQAYEYFASKIEPKRYANLADLTELKAFIKDAFNSYTQRSTAAWAFFSGESGRVAAVQRLIEQSQQVESREAIKTAIISCYQALYRPCDEVLRSEGHLHTLFTIVAGLIDEVTDFKQQFEAVCPRAELESQPELASSP